MGKCQPHSVMSSFESSLWLPAGFKNDWRRQRGGLCSSGQWGRDMVVTSEAYGRGTWPYNMVCVCVSVYVCVCAHPCVAV